MKSLYGTVINHSPRSLFDIQHIYPNARMMRSSILSDEVPTYGYVLVYYGEPGEELYEYNLKMDQTSEVISVDYNKTVWQKRPDPKTLGLYYFAIARLNSVLPYTQEVALKGYENQVVFQRLNAFPIQGDLSYYYQDFGITSTEQELIHFDNKAMEKFNTEYPSIIPVATYPNLYAANEDINNEDIKIGDYVLISYSSDMRDVYNNKNLKEFISKEHSQEFIDNQLIDQQHYGNDDKSLYIIYHQAIFQKQQSKYVLSSENRIGLYQITNDGMIIENDEPEYDYHYRMSSDNSLALQTKIETEINRSDTLIEAAQNNIKRTQEVIQEDTEKILENSRNILDYNEKINNKIQSISNNVENLRAYENDTNTALGEIKEKTLTLEERVASVNSNLSNLNNNIYAPLVTISDNIINNNNSILNEINNVVLPNLESILKETENIDTSANDLKTFIQTTITNANSKLSAYKTALNNANNGITTAKNNANAAISSLNTHIETLTDASYNITISNSSINDNVASLNALATIDTIGEYTNNITKETTSITNQLSSLSTLGTNLQSVVNGSLTTIKNLTTITDPTYTNLTGSTEPDNILNFNTNIKNQVNAIKQSINNNNKINTYITNIKNLIEDMNTKLSSLKTIYTTLVDLNNNIKILNNEIFNKTEDIQGNLVKKLRVYYEAIESDIKGSNNGENIAEYNKNIQKLENENIIYTEHIQLYLKINEEQNELLNTVINENSLYLTMLSWYKYIFLPSIKTITIEDEVQAGEIVKRDIPDALKTYNTYTLEYPTK